MALLLRGEDDEFDHEHLRPLSVSMTVKVETGESSILVGFTLRPLILRA
jgi:hypothetical protein